VYRALPGDDDGRRAWEAALCAGAQGKFWDVHPKLFRQSDFTGEGLREFAVANGVNGAKFDTCMTAHKFVADVDQDIADAKQAGVSGSPTVFINGNRLAGYRADYDEIIDKELARFSHEDSDDR
jgi:protein-disulfide isomerase